MFAWNSIMPAIFGIVEITYWQALAISWAFVFLIKAIKKL